MGLRRAELARFQTTANLSSPPPPPVTTSPVTVTLPRPKRHHSLRVPLTLAWTWNYGTTTLDKATMAASRATCG